MGIAGAVGIYLFHSFQHEPTYRWVRLLLPKLDQS